MKEFSTYQGMPDEDMMIFIMKKQNMIDDENYYKDVKNCDEHPCYNMGSIYDYMDTSNCKPKDKKSLIREIQDCSKTCYDMMSNLIDKDCNRRQTQIHLLHECAKTCDTTVVFIITKSMHNKEHALLCSKICHACANECSKYPDAESQHCARICFSCAKACLEYTKY